MNRKVKSAVLLGDTHVPFHDTTALNIVYQVIEDLQPTSIVHVGDLLDCYSISRFAKDPDRIISLQDEISEAQKVLGSLAKASPKSKRFLLEGNHENRLHKTICHLDGPARELARLTSIRTAMTWPSLLDLGKNGWTFVPEKHQPTTSLIPDMALKHGSVVRKYAGYTAKGEFDNYHMSGASGHTHRGGLYSHRTLSGVSHWIETFCTCTLTPDYLTHPNWQHGAWCVSWTDNNTIALEPIIINDGAALFRGKSYSG